MAPPDVALIDDAALLARLPSRSAGWTKFTSGHVLVAGGSRGLTGAPSLAAEAAQRAGAGYVTACVPASQQPVLAQRLLEAMTRGLPDDDGAHTADGADEVLELAGRGGALVVGPGLGRSDGAFAFARALLARAEVAVVLDADGLNAHAGDLAALAGRGAPTILTPHEGELARLLGVESSAVQARRLEHARAAAEQSQAIVVLKGDDTLVAEPGGLVAVSPGATGALATAGTGDVLSGVLAAVLSRDLDPFMAACAGVRLHAAGGHPRRPRQGRRRRHRARRDRGAAVRALRESSPSAASMSASLGSRRPASWMRSQTAGPSAARAGSRKRPVRRS